MALPLGKLAVLIGAGIVGSVLAKEGRISTVSDFATGAFKIVFKHIRHDDSTPSSAKPQNDSLLSQVNNLRQELQLLASNRSVTIVTSSGSGSGRYSTIVVVIVVASGYIWWKGLKLPNMMPATRRGLSDASKTVTKQLENVYSSIEAAKKLLSSRVDRVDCNLDECAELTAATREEVSEIRGGMTVIGVDVRSVQNAVQTLETKINRFEGKQDITHAGVRRLVDCAWRLEKSRNAERIQGDPSSSSRPALEMPQTAMTGSLPPIPSIEPPSPAASDGSHQELHGISAAEGLSSPDASNGVRVTEDTSIRNSGAGLFGRSVSSISAAILTRTRSAVQSFK